MRRICASILAFFLLLGLSACSVGGTITTDPGTTAETGESQAPAIRHLLPDRR